MDAIEGLLKIHKYMKDLLVVFCEPFNQLIEDTNLYIRAATFPESCLSLVEEMFCSFLDSAKQDFK